MTWIEAYDNFVDCAIRLYREQLISRIYIWQYIAKGPNELVINIVQEMKKYKLSVKNCGKNTRDLENAEQESFVKIVNVNKKTKVCVYIMSKFELINVTVFSIWFKV